MPEPVAVVTSPGRAGRGRMPHTGRMTALQSPAAPLRRSVSARLRARVAQGTDVALLVAAAAPGSAPETLEVLAGGVPWEIETGSDPFGSRVHVLRDLPEGTVEIVYAAEEVAPAPEPQASPMDEVTYLRPSRYCEVDEFGRIAEDIVDGRTGVEAAHGIIDWVSSHLEYVPGASTVQDSARSTFVSRRGVCRDYAHLAATLLRAAGIPARCVSVYAPGLHPMDFHLVVEALVEGRWLVLDATRLAPRRSMLRIATGMDAADTAFMTTLTGDVRLETMQVIATVDPLLPAEVWAEDVALR